MSLVIDCENPQFIVTDIWYRPIAKFPDYHLLMEATNLTKEEVSYSIQTGRSVCEIHVLIDKVFAVYGQSRKAPEERSEETIDVIAQKCGLTFTNIRTIKRHAMEKLAQEEWLKELLYGV